MADAYFVFPSMPHCLPLLDLLLIKVGLMLTVRGVDYGGKFSQFPAELYMLSVLKGFAGCVMEFSPFLPPKFSWFRCTFR
jgi:hypothetical protein